MDHPGIVVGVAGSSTSDSAIDWAARDASMRNVALTVVYVGPALLVNWSLTPAASELTTWQVCEGRQILADASKIAYDVFGRPSETGALKVLLTASHG